MNDSTALERVEPGAIAQADPEAFEHAFDAYQRIQAIVDRRMPDQIVKIGPKMFRKKGYWRAVAVAFNIDVTMQSEQYVDRADDWGWAVVYTATAPNGRSQSGDGICMASEKSKGRMEATEHNVRSHAHTRAQNRAISNLVGFGEVSADELSDDDRPAKKTSSPRPQQTQPQASGDWDGSVPITFGKHKGLKWSEVEGDYLTWLVENMEPTKGPAHAMATREIGRRALLEAKEPEVMEPPPYEEEEPPWP